MSKLLSPERLEQIRIILEKNLPMQPEMRMKQNMDILTHIDALEEQVKQLTAERDEWRDNFWLAEKRWDLVQSELKGRDRLIARVKALREGLWLLAGENRSVVHGMIIADMGLKHFVENTVKDILAADDQAEKEMG